MSEASRIDYQRRLEQSAVAALSAHLEKELASQIESQALAIHAQVKNVNLGVALLLVVLGLFTLVAGFPYGRVVAVLSQFCMVIWLCYTQSSV